MFHYNLLNQLHLPYMLRSSTEHKYDYSRIICVNASREILSRFIMFRSFNRNAFCCRTVDFFALMAAMALVLVHLDSHRSSQVGNLLAHQSLSDRAMIEQAQENMEQVSRLNADALSTQSANLLRSLLVIEAEATDNQIPSADSVSVQGLSTEMAQPDDDDNGTVRVYIPYFGIIKIAREGVISKEMLRPQPLVDSNSMAVRSEPLHADSAVLSGSSGLSGTMTMKESGCDHVEEFPIVLSGAYAASQAQLGEFSVPSTSDDGVSAQFGNFESNFPNGISDPLLQQYEYPPLIAGVDDWAFQGVDMAFFDSLMRGTRDSGNGGTQGPAW